MLQDGDKVKVSLKAILVSGTEIEQQSNKEVALKNFYQEKTLLLFFYPKDMTPGCSTEAESFRDAYTQFKKYNVEILGCSRDSVASHCKFIGKKELPYSLLSDEKGEITESFGVWQEKKMYGKTFMGIVRSTFIIEKGKIIKVFPKVKPANHVEELLEFFKNRNF